MVRHLRAFTFASVILFCCRPAAAAPIVIDFEGLADLEVVTSQIAGLTFQHATALTAGVSLNELEFPTESGQAVVSDDGGPMSVTFGSPVYSVGGFFTYLEPLTLDAYDGSGGLLGSVSAAFLNNLALSGDAGSSPNELLEFGSATPIASIVLTGDPLGGSFVLDNLTFDPTPASVPEPDSLTLVGAGALVLFCTRRRTRAEVRP